MFKIVPFTENYKELWDSFVSGSKNGIFLFYRDYMDYHADRFKDFSLMFFEENKLIAILPANISGKTVISHEGLTFGGIISGNDMKTTKMLRLFQSVLHYFLESGIENFIYKPVPHIYHKTFADEDLYALFVNKAALLKRDVSSAINLENKIQFNKRRQRCLKKSKKFGLEIGRSFDYAGYMAIVEELLTTKYSQLPTHNHREIELLCSRFPDNIKLFSAFSDKTMVAGTLVYEFGDVIHTQYLASSAHGKEMSALDAVLDYLINEYYAAKKYFEFGKSTLNHLDFLNTGVLNQKEEFGARAICLDTYCLTV
jgi:hypothetical protein